MSILKTKNPIKPQPNAIYVANATSITVSYGDGSVYSVNKSHKHYDAIRKALKNNNLEQIKHLLSASEAVKKILGSEGGSTVVTTTKRGKLCYNGITLDERLSNFIILLKSQNKSTDHVLKFVDNLMENPASFALDELYQFLEHASMSINEKGNFLAYKLIRSNYTDLRTGNFDNSLGALVKQDRKACDDNRANTCSDGLHFCSINYIKEGPFSYDDGSRLIVVEINPKDVVSIPIDYNFTKGRCCAYRVVGEIENIIEFLQKN